MKKRTKEFISLVGCVRASVRKCQKKKGTIDGNGNKYGVITGMRFAIFMNFVFPYFCALICSSFMAKHLRKCGLLIRFLQIPPNRSTFA